jgi:hypothetical protein
MSFWRPFSTLLRNSRQVSVSNSFSASFGDSRQMSFLRPFSSYLGETQQISIWHPFLSSFERLALNERLALFFGSFWAIRAK